MTSAAATALRRTPLYEDHVAAGARLVPFGGWEMPLQYAGVRPEHLAVRGAAGVFDVSHMGQVEVRGAQAVELLQRVLSNDVQRMAEGGAQYSVMCNERGGVLDDLFTYRLDERAFLSVTNACNHGKDLAWLRAQAQGFEVEVIDRAEDYAMLAVQGPRARDIVAELADADLPPRMQCRRGTVAGISMLVCGTGYTGEDGVELMLDPAAAPDTFSALLRAGVAPAGLGARDTLRLEVCFHLYGNDLSEDRGPVEAGLGWCCKEETGFIGAEAVAAARSDRRLERLVAFCIEGRGIARAGNPVIGGGEVTSGTFSPSLQRGIGMAYVPAERSEPGTEIEIDVRGTVRVARVRKRPLYRKAS